MIYFDSDMSKSTNTVACFDWKAVIHRHVHLRRESQSHASAHVLMRLYPIDKSLVCLQAKEGRHVRKVDKSLQCINLHLHLSYCPGGRLCWWSEPEYPNECFTFVSGTLLLNRDENA